jgi:hypothetical protein
VLVEGPLHDTKIAQRIKDTTEAVPHPRDMAVAYDLDFVFPIPIHPMMRPKIC